MQLGDGRRPYLSSKQPPYDTYINLLEHEPTAGHAAVALAASSAGPRLTLPTSSRSVTAATRQNP
jgi:hypothetical protein